MKKFVLSLIVAALALPLAAQDAAKNPISAGALATYKTVATNVLKSIEKMPADKFSFKAVDTVMPFSEFAGHLAEANYSYCSAVSTTAPPKMTVRKETSKEALVAAFKGAMDYCVAAYSSMTDEKLASTVKRGTREMPLSNLVFGNIGHTFEHYGNMVTYLRMNGLVPPSSEPR